ncbi:MAG: DUF3098 domain-containing protein [Lentimicrobiaceae bacterium]|jgi:hypothetical protein|nr:DUF3098 domain-containing protein [Lentimicrobiaceae bacterium]
MIKDKKKAGVAGAKYSEEEKTDLFAFGKENYKLLLLGLACIVIGFILMVGGGSDSPDIFNDSMFGFRRMTLAPLLILAGYAIEIFAIMKKTKE